MLRTRERSIALTAVVALVVLLLPSGCLEFEEQEVTWAYDAVHDRLDVQLVVRGVHTHPEGIPDREHDAGLAKAGRQLDQIAKGRRLFALMQSFPLGFDLDEIAESDASSLEKALCERVAVDQGDFFRAADGCLCGWQRLRISGFTEFLQMFDQLVRRTIAPPKERAEFLATFGLRDAESRSRLARAIEHAGSLLSHQDGVVLFRIPASEPDARAWLARFQPDAPDVSPTRIDQRDGDERDLEYTIQALRWIGATAAATPDGITLTLGDPARPGGPWTTPRLPADPVRKPAPDNLAPMLAERHIPIRTDLTDESLARDFADFRRH